MFLCEYKSATRCRVFATICHIIQGNWSGHQKSFASKLEMLQQERYVSNGDLSVAALAHLSLAQTSLGALDLSATNDHLSKVGLMIQHNPRLKETYYHILYYALLGLSKLAEHDYVQAWNNSSLSYELLIKQKEVGSFEFWGCYEATREFCSH